MARKRKSTVIALTYGFADNSSGETLCIPKLRFFSSAERAAACCEGIDIVEGDLWFFGSDGAPLKATFSEEAFIDRDKYFPGVYSLKPGSGNSLYEELIKILTGNSSAGSWIALYAAHTDNFAQQNGWPDSATMHADIREVLESLPPHMLNFIRFERFQ